MVIGEKWIVVDADRRLRVAGLAEAFAVRPAIVGAGDAVVDFLPAALADDVNEDAAGPWLHAERERVAQTQGPDGPVVPRGGRVKGVVRGNGAVGVDAQHLAEEIRQRL